MLCHISCRAALLYWGKRRAYLRMNAQDRGQFQSYGAMLAAKLADGLLVVIGGSLLAAATVMLAIEYAGEWLALCVISISLFCSGANGTSGVDDIRRNSVEHSFRRHRCQQVRTPALRSLQLCSARHPLGRGKIRSCACAAVTSP